MKKIIVSAVILLCALTTLNAQNNTPKNQFVREGGYGKAVTYSVKNNALVIYISGGKGENGVAEKYTAKEYAQLLQAGFRNPKYTNFPTEAVVFYRETEKERGTIARVLINGLRYKTNDGASTFSPKAIGNHIDVFTKYYREKNNIPLNDKEAINQNN